jgi:hypothetical protein
MGDGSPSRPAPIPGRSSWCRSRGSCPNHRWRPRSRPNLDRLRNPIHARASSATFRRTAPPEPTQSRPVPASHLWSERRDRRGPARRTGTDRARDRPPSPPHRATRHITSSPRSDRPAPSVDLARRPRASLVSFALERTSATAGDAVLSRLLHTVISRRSWPKPAKPECSSCNCDSTQLPLCGDGDHRSGVCGPSLTGTAL